MLELGCERTPGCLTLNPFSFLNLYPFPPAKSSHLTNPAFAKSHGGCLQFRVWIKDVPFWEVFSSSSLCCASCSSDQDARTWRGIGMAEWNSTSSSVSVPATIRHDIRQVPQPLGASLSSSLKVEIIISMLAGHDYVWLTGPQEVVILSYGSPRRFWMALLLKSLLTELKVPQRPQETWAPIASPPVCDLGPGSSGRAGLREHLCGAILGRESLPRLGTSGFIKLIVLYMIPTLITGWWQRFLLFYMYCGGGEEKYPQTLAWEEEEFPEVDANSFLQTLRQGSE